MATSNERFIEIARELDPGAEATEHRGQLTIKTHREKIVELCKEFRSNEECDFDMLIDITAIDWNRRGERYEVVYNLYSNNFKNRVRLKTGVEAKNPQCPTVSDVWENANWYERETYDMFGIIFEGHPNLRRFYMPEDFADPESGEPLYPMRKDFPLMGIPDSLPLPAYPEKYGEVKEK
jgi:NADH-quinone oxidoreductase subunit C